MCNAWGHPPGCTCGWGGEGHAGKSPGGCGRAATVALRRQALNPPADAAQYRYQAPRSRESYCVPNARCPVCGALVFFYQASDGGRVFFDQLGPPWPKHPCTDNSPFRPSARADSPRPSETGKPHTPEWQAEWEPLLNVRLLRSRPIKATLVKGTLGKKDFQCFVGHDHLEAQAPWLVRQVGNERIELSTLITTREQTGHLPLVRAAPDVTPIVLIAHQTDAEADAYARRHTFGTGAFRVAAGSPPAHGQRSASRGSEARLLLEKLRSAYVGFRRNLPLWDGAFVELRQARPEIDWRMLDEAIRLHTASAAYKRAIETNPHRYRINGVRVESRRKRKKGRG